jgi:PRTRC genetic system ThiF family protein
MEIDFDYAQACRLLLPSYESIGLALIGCGGTGSWLAPSVVRVGRLLHEKFQKKVLIHFIDPDNIEQKNVYRQNFCDAEVGRNKAASLAYRYGLAWGMEIMAIQKPFEWNLFSHECELMVMLGCVDGPIGRRELAEYTARWSRDWWLDCGNFKAAGQVLLGGGDQHRDPFQLPGYCSWLPLPSVQHPELLQDAAWVPDPVDAGLSCADLAMRDSQGLAINQRVAAEASDYLVRMLLTKDLAKIATYLDLASGSSRSVYITKENVKIGE